MTNTNPQWTAMVNELIEAKPKPSKTIKRKCLEYALMIGGVLGTIGFAKEGIKHYNQGDRIFQSVTNKTPDPQVLFLVPDEEKKDIVNEYHAGAGYLGAAGLSAMVAAGTFISSRMRKYD